MKRILKPPSFFTSCDASLNWGLLIFVSSTSLPVSSFQIPVALSFHSSGRLCRGRRVLCFLCSSVLSVLVQIANSSCWNLPSVRRATRSTLFPLLQVLACIPNANVLVYGLLCTVYTDRNILLPFFSHRSLATFLQLKGSSAAVSLSIPLPVTKTNVQRDLGASSWPWSQKMEPLDTLLPWVNLTCVVVERFSIHRGWIL